MLIKIKERSDFAYILILEGTFSDDMTTTGTSFQEESCIKLIHNKL